MPADNDNRPTADAPIPPVGANRPALDADDLAELRNDADDPDCQTDIGLDETFPASDAPSTVRPGDTGEPAPSSGFDR